MQTYISGPASRLKELTVAVIGYRHNRQELVVPFDTIAMTHSRLARPQRQDGFGASMRLG